ncbi:hypothetical protein [Streptomyces justiciae]|uniref:Muconolactone isomerase domain-containing protein n=1 Tax=Streptomyces justiciae TaxID=2780140 RepID=A0ABU3M5E7_9ACTN|nr:hypothetical protein [Streptomyces justiciae]MBE8471151.1 hypothetical protein [Streptomyces justiciae]MCW8376944.1 hypothetical protein [Streptomyces justiciae]MDT7846266.1 hypothetical protein [Streptomyces justiciae]
MRVMLKATLDTDKANEVLGSGKMQDLLGETLERIKPEAAYFGPEGGRRTCYLVFDMNDSSDLPPIGEPFFSNLNAQVEVFPIMNLDDLKKGLSQLR